MSVTIEICRDPGPVPQLKMSDALGVTVGVASSSIRHLVLMSVSGRDRLGTFSPPGQGDYDRGRSSIPSVSLASADYGCRSGDGLLRALKLRAISL